MRRAWLILVLASLAWQATDLTGLLLSFLTGEASHGCFQECSTEESSGEDCSSRCPACPCAPQGTPVVPPCESPRPEDPAPCSRSSPLPSAPRSEAHPRAVFHPPTAR
ncbi:MAG: hypothetical protein L0323_04255 [Planctomycetes bacterium]|nr:hypothetical protein [Planctomycetota bacterium]